MKSGPGNQRRMGAGPGGMPEPRTCTLRFLNPILIAVDSCRCGIKGSVSSGLLEPPYTEPYVRWCGRTAEVTPPPTRYVLGLETILNRSSKMLSVTSETWKDAES